MSFSSRKMEWNRNNNANTLSCLLFSQITISNVVMIYCAALILLNKYLLSFSALLLSSLLPWHALFLSFTVFSPPPVHLLQIGSPPHLCISVLSLTPRFLISPASLFFYYLSLLLSCPAIPAPQLRSLRSTSFTSFFSSLAISCCSSLSFFSVCSFSFPPTLYILISLPAVLYLSVFPIFPIPFTTIFAFLVSPSPNGRNGLSMSLQGPKWYAFLVPIHYYLLLFNHLNNADVFASSYKCIFFSGFI